MNITRDIALFVAGFALCEAFAVSSNPLATPDFPSAVATFATEPDLLLTGVIMRPVDVLVPLAVAAGAAGVAVTTSGKKEQDAPKP